ncbi:uncharacterized protein [Ptychodera flava]|uniref:uncharacterized protein n=1 Tax=Ptychodera flava TaxID=63121 RepID=UPI003969D291
MLMERLPGKLATDQKNADWEKILFQVGRHLAEVHSLTAVSQKYGYLGEHQPMDPQDTWVDAFEVMWGKLIDDIVMTGYYGDKEKDALTGLFQEHRALFDRPVLPHLLHMDIWHQNILVDENSQVTGVLDWDRALWGDPEIEFAVLDYCDISGPAFWEGYGKKRDETPEAKTRQVFTCCMNCRNISLLKLGDLARRSLPVNLRDK